MSKQEIRCCLTEVEMCEGVVVQVSSLWSGTERAAMVMCASDVRGSKLKCLMSENTPGGRDVRRFE